MEFEEEKKSALLMLEGLELGTMTAAESYAVLDEADPTLVYFIFKWLRKRYREDPKADEVLGRLREVRSSYRSLTRKAKTGEEDPVVGWFEGAHAYAELESAEFIDIIVDKLEG